MKVDMANSLQTKSVVRTEHHRGTGCYVKGEASLPSPTINEYGSIDNRSHQLKDLAFDQFDPMKSVNTPNGDMDTLKQCSKTRRQLHFCRSFGFKEISLLRPLSRLPQRFESTYQY
jgi:hypothetical protein